MWMAVPLTLATSMGIATLALDLPLSLSEVNAGLVPPAAALLLWGVLPAHTLPPSCPVC